MLVISASLRRAADCNFGTKRDSGFGLPMGLIALQSGSGSDLADGALFLMDVSAGVFSGFCTTCGLGGANQSRESDWEFSPSHGMTPRGRNLL